MTQRPTLTLRDVAEAARVRRAVVSMWRRRPATTGGRVVAFPDAVTSVDDVEHFDRAEILDYLRVTRRGNNPDVAQDVLALSAPAGVEVEDVVTLLCLHALTGEELSAADLLTLAAQADPQDEVLLREVREMTITEELTTYVDELVEASFGPSDALTRLETTRLRRGEGLRGLSEPLVELLVAVVAAAREVAGPDEAVLVPAVDGTLFRRLAGGFAGVALEQGEGRSVRRRALVDEVTVQNAGAGPAVHVLSVVGATEVDALRTIDDLVLALGPTDVGAVVGPASTLCDPLVGDLARDRTETLGGKALAAAIRLPRGLWKGAHRQSLALWILHGARENVLVSVADLEGATIDHDDLASDIAAALLEPSASTMSGSRAPRYARRVDLTTVLARPAVVPRGTVAVRLGSGRSATHLDRIHTSTLTTSRGVAGCDVIVARSPGTVTRRRRSLAELRSEGHLVVRRGVRVDLARADPAGTVPVLTADDAIDGAHLDPFDAARLYPRATRTDPGDVVVVDGPRPRARVDVVGGALVAAPSRILRLRPGAPVGPHVLAAVVNALAPAGTAWTTWTVPLLPETESAALDRALADVARHQDELRRHLGAAGDLVTSLIEGVAAGAVTLEETLTRPEAG